MLVGYRTYIVSALVAIFGFLETTDWGSVFNDPKGGIITIGAGVIMAIMRTITSTPPGSQTPKKPE
jgi:hypothetical protein